MKPSALSQIKKALSVAFVAIVLMFTHGGLHAATYYVDSTVGSDLNDGLSTSSPWATLDKVNSVTFSPGDSILFKKGSKWIGRLAPKGSGTSTSPITFGSYGDGTARPILEGPASGTTEVVLIFNQEYIVVENFEVTAPAPGVDRFFRGIAFDTNQDVVWRGNVIRNNYLHDIDSHTVTDRHRQGAIYLRATGGANKTARFDDVVIDGNIVIRCASRGILFADPSTTQANFSLNPIVRNNAVQYTGLEGILVYSAKNVLIEYNTVYHAGGYTSFDSSVTVPIAGLWGRGGDFTIQFNEVAYTYLTNPTPYESMDSQAFDIDLKSPGIHIIQYNYSHDNQGGVFLWMGDPGPDFNYAIIRYNISQNDGQGFIVNGESSGRVFELHSHPNGAIFPVYVYNNMFYSNTKIWVMDRSGTNSGVHPGWEFKNNIFHAPAGVFDDQTYIIYDYNAHYPHSAPTVDTHAITTEPMLVQPGSGGDGIGTVNGYKLLVGSPLIGTGILISNNGGFDFWGNPVSATAAPNRGAYNGAGESGVVPAAPGDLTASAKGSSRIALTWKDNSTDESKFEIERSTDNSTFVKIAEVGANVTTYTNTGLSSATIYYYRLRACNSNGCSAYSNTASAKTK